MHIRRARLADAAKLYHLGLATREVKVSASEPFMDRDDFTLRIADKAHVFLVAEQNSELVGFICASTSDTDRPLKKRYACLVYVVTVPEWRRRGVATQLYRECAAILKMMGMTHLYTLADADTAPIRRFLTKRGFRVGEKVIWMDKRL